MSSFAFREKKSTFCDFLLSCWHFFSRRYNIFFWLCYVLFQVFSSTVTKEMVPRLFVNLLSRLFAVSSTFCFVIFLFHQLPWKKWCHGFSPTWCLVTLLFGQIAISSICCFTHLLFCQPENSSTFCYEDVLFHQLTVLSKSEFINLPFTNFFANWLFH